MSIKARREAVVNKRPDLSFAISNQPGQVGKVVCGDTMKIYKSHEAYVARYPPHCTTGDSARDARANPSVPGYDHPHVIMIDDFFYTINMDLP